MLQVKMHAAALQRQVVLVHRNHFLMQAEFWKERDYLE